jgi:predicted nucleic acid-binding Zn ribbon protein
MYSKTVGVVLTLMFSVILHLANGELNKLCTSSSGCPKNQICKYSRCKCSEGTFLWHGNKCLQKRNYGDECQDQIECSSSGDPHLHCIAINNNQKENRCVCSEKYDFSLNEKKCIKKLVFTVNKMDMNQEGSLSSVRFAGEGIDSVQ